MEKFVKPKTTQMYLLEDTKEDYIELNSLPTDLSDKWILIEASVDSRATGSVGPKGLFRQFELKPSLGSKARKSYVSATIHKVPNLGERIVELRSEDVEDLKM